MTITSKRAETLVTKALLTGYRRLRREGKSAKDVQGKQIDLTTRGDIVVGKAIVNVFRRQKEGFLVYTEEQGLFKLTENPSYTVIVDDIDGTANFKTGMGMLAHGSVVGIFDSTTPRFNDCLASGFLEFNSGNLFLAVKGEGSYIIQGFAFGKRQKKKIETSGRTSVRGVPIMKIGLDLNLQGDLSEAFGRITKRYWPKDFGSKAMHLALTACGALDLFVSNGILTATESVVGRKTKAGPEEIGPLYLLVKGAGGVVLDWEGMDIGYQKIGLKDASSPDLIVAATAKLGQEFARELRSDPQIIEYLSARSRHGK